MVKVPSSKCISRSVPEILQSATGSRKYKEVAQSASKVAQSVLELSQEP